MSEKSRPCEICKQPIEPERLEFLPDTRLCAVHAREIEKYGGEFRISSQVETTSKPGSLKKNYGGVSTHKHRNHEALRKLHDEHDK